MNTGAGRVSVLTSYSRGSSLGTLLRVAVDSLKGSMLVCSDVCFIRSKDSKGRHVTITYYYANEVNDLKVIRREKTIVLNFNKRKQWFKVPMNDLTNENDYKYFFVGYKMPAYSEIKIGQWEANDDYFDKFYNLRGNVPNFNQWSENTTRLKHLYNKYPAIRISLKK
jgi:hypothetical protein